MVERMIPVIQKNGKVKFISIFEAAILIRQNRSNEMKFYNIPNNDIMSKQIKALTPGQLKPINKLIGAKIESLRETLGITQEDFAKRVNLSRVSIVNIEAGKQNLNMDQIEQFSRAFGIAPKHLLRGIWF